MGIGLGTLMLFVGLQVTPLTAQVGAWVSPGDRVRLRVEGTNPRWWVIGDFVSSDSANIVVRRSGNPVAYPLAEVSEFQVRTVDRHPGSRMSAGFLIGAGLVVRARACDLCGT